MNRVSCLFHHYRVYWIKRNEERLLRTAIVPTSISVNVVKLRSNRYYNLNLPCSLIKGKSWKEKLEYAAACYQANTKDALNAIVSLAQEDCEKKTNTANRLLYLAMDMALNQGRTDVAEEMFKLLPQRIHVLATSLKVRFLVQQKRFWDALNEVEKVLNSDTATLDVSTKISKSVMDEFYKAVSSSLDAVDEAKRLFTVQRLLSRYNKRTTKTLRDLLLSDMYISSGRSSLKSDLKIDDIVLDKIVEDAPEVLTQ